MPKILFLYALLIASAVSRPVFAQSCDGLTPLGAVQMTVERAMNQCDYVLTVNYEKCEPYVFRQIRDGMDALKASGCIAEYDLTGMGGSHSAGFGEFSQFQVIASTRTQIFHVSSKKTYIRDSEFKKYRDFLMSYARWAREGCHEGCPR